MLGNQGGRMLDVKTQVDPLATGISVLSNGVKPCVCCYVVYFCQVFARGSLGFSYSPLKRKRIYEYLICWKLMIKRHVNVRLSWVTINRRCRESDAGKILMHVLIVKIVEAGESH